MSLGGGIIMVVSVGFVTGLLAWCVYRVVATSGVVERLRSPADIDTHDTQP